VTRSKYQVVFGPLSDDELRTLIRMRKALASRNLSALDNDPAVVAFRARVVPAMRNAGLTSETQVDKVWKRAVHVPVRRDRPRPRAVRARASTGTSLGGLDPPSPSPDLTLPAPDPVGLVCVAAA
jgi:hypothetical protein